MANKNGQFEKDDPRINRNGRGIGTRNFSTDFDEVVKEIAKTNKITVSEARKILLKVAFTQAKSGQFNFWKEIIDRYYGKEPDNLIVKQHSIYDGKSTATVQGYVSDQKDIQPDQEDSGS